VGHHRPHPGHLHAVPPIAEDPHMAFYATSGAGKGYAAKVLQARLAQGQDVRIFGVDQDEDEEYTGSPSTSTARSSAWVHPVERVVGPSSHPST
jgi:hypothetical protein